MLRRLLLTALLLLGSVLITVPAYAAGSAVTHSVSTTVALSSWPAILAGFCGFGSAQLTAFLTHHRAPQWVKSGVNLALSTLAGVLISVTVIAGATWKDYVSEIAISWIIALGTHFSGMTALVGNSTSTLGIGAGASPIVPPPADDAQGSGVY